YWSDFAVDVVRHIDVADGVIGHRKGENEVTYLQEGLLLWRESSPVLPLITIDQALFLSCCYFHYSACIHHLLIM
ncbi:hypothetical protein, partial [Klebsiella aerogenes]|uniref:hypothetical protein n=1 Tax=Klebsiella aerogenes TaxID=548 RepID=UPI0019535F65